MSSAITNNDCPECDKDIGIMAILKAGLPNRIRCPSCKTPVKYVPFPWIPTIAAILLYVMIIVFTLSTVSVLGARYTSNNFLVQVIYFFILWIPFDLFITLYIRKNHKLVRK